MPPNWRGNDPIPYTFVYVDQNIDSEGYIDFFKICFKENVRNPRIITPRVLTYSSLFHPSFYQSVKNCHRDSEHPLYGFTNNLKPLTMNRPVTPGLLDSKIIFYLQSMIFLSGVTLSAAIIQNRWSHGTLESKLNRLWQAGCLAETEDIPSLRDLDICGFVLITAQHIERYPVESLISMKKFYSRILTVLVDNIFSESVKMEEVKLDEKQRLKYGFIDDLKNILGSNLHAIVLYGSATNSESFADYDLIVIVDNLDDGLQKLKGLSPTYNGLELNISLFDKEDFWTYQLASGDNLADHALCLYGSITVPHKSSADLLARNFSFGFVRFRQLLGMASFANEVGSDSDDKKNLMDYFIKIPLNVSKGIQGCTERIRTNEEIRKWFIDTLDFDVDYLRAQSHLGNHAPSVATAAWATQEVMHKANESLNFFQEAREENLILETH